MKEVIKLDTVDQYNRLFGLETLHPLVSVIDLSKADLSPHTDIKFDFYTILLSECKCEAYMYGHQYYDFSDGTLLCLSPGESINMKENSKNFPSKGWILAFHPDLICGTPLGLHIHNYTFFSYLPEEALHISLREKQIILEFMDKINQELERCIDRHSKKIVSKYIELLLDYCVRFYERQFITREEINNDVLVRFEQLLNGYMDSGKASQHGIPTVKYFADKICLSSNYLGDLVKSETGKTAQEFIQLKMVNVAKNALIDPNLNTKQIAEILGFQHPQHFMRFLKNK